MSTYLKEAFDFLFVVDVKNWVGVREIFLIGIPEGGSCVLSGSWRAVLYLNPHMPLQQPADYTMNPTKEQFRLLKPTTDPTASRQIRFTPHTPRILPVRAMTHRQLPMLHAFP